MHRSHGAHGAVPRRIAQPVLLIVAIAAIISSGCAQIECTGVGADAVCPGDDRPATLEYVTTTILRPSCANAQCHGAFRNRKGYRFDTIEHAQQSMVKLDGSTLVTPGDPDTSQLYLVLVRSTTADGKFPRMPLDEPLAGADIALVKRWITEGADGLVFP